MKHLYSIPLSIGLLFLAGCEMGKKKIKPVKNEQEVAVNIPVAGDDDIISSFFDTEIEEFAMIDNNDEDISNPDNTLVADSDSVIPTEYEEEFAWIEDDDLQEDFNVVYYDFDKYELRKDQEETIAENVARLVHEVELARQEGKDPLIVIEGHSCSITRSRVYNLALSEKRAKIIADKLVDAGVARENIKVVGRGEEYPAIVDGKQISGSKDEQWPNRRAETHLIYA